MAKINYSNWEEDGNTIESIGGEKEIPVKKYHRERKPGDTIDSLSAEAETLRCDASEEMRKGNFDEFNRLMKEVGEIHSVMVSILKEGD